MSNANPMLKLYPLADALQMTLTMVNGAEFGGQLKAEVDQWFDGFTKSIIVKIGKSHFDYSSGNAWCVVHMMGNLAVIFLSDNGRRVVYAYVVAEDKLDQALLAQMIRKDAWSRKDLLRAMDMAVVEVYLRKWDTPSKSGWGRKPQGKLEVQTYNLLREKGFGSSDAERLTGDVLAGDITIEKALLVSTAAGAAQNRASRPKSPSVQNDLKAIGDLFDNKQKVEH